MIVQLYVIFFIVLLLVGFHRACIFHLAWLYIHTSFAHRRYHFSPKEKAGRVSHIF